MAIAQRQQHGGNTAGAVKSAIEITKQSARGGWFATVFSAITVGLSRVSVHVSTLQAPQLEVHAPPTIHYARDSGGETEVLAIPVTIANSGARSATVVSMELEVENLETKATKRYVQRLPGRASARCGGLQPPVRTAEHSRPRRLHGNGALLSCGCLAAEADLRQGRVCLPPEAQRGRAGAALVPRLAAGPRPAGAHRLADDAALVLRAATRHAARAHHHALQGLVADHGGEHGPLTKLARPACCGPALRPTYGAKGQSACSFGTSVTVRRSR